MSKGFANEASVFEDKKKLNSNQSNARLISWSPWPPANFQTKYPAFPFVLTILLIIVVKFYLSLLK